MLPGLEQWDESGSLEKNGLFLSYILQNIALLFLRDPLFYKGSRHADAPPTVKKSWAHEMRGSARKHGKNIPVLDPSLARGIIEDDKQTCEA